MWLTLCRPGEAAGVRWAEFDLDAALWRIPAERIERQQAHVEPNAVRRSYNHAEHRADRAKMMQQWADMLDRWQKRDDKVMPIKHKAVAWPGPWPVLLADI